MPGLTDFLEQVYLDHLGLDVAVVAEDTHLALFTNAAGETIGGTEVTGGAYARVLINQDSVTGPFWVRTVSTIDNNASFSFATATANWGQVWSWAVMDATTAGNGLFWGWMANSIINFVGLATGDIIHAPAHGFVNANRVLFINSGGGLPTGLAEQTEYFVISSAANNFQVSTTEGGAAVTLTADGDGEVGISQMRDVKDGDTLTIGAGDIDFSLD